MPSSWNADGKQNSNPIFWGNSLRNDPEEIPKVPEFLGQVNKAWLVGNWEFTAPLPLPEFFSPAGFQRECRGLGAGIGGTPGKTGAVLTRLEATEEEEWENPLGKASRAP